jgi:hypothetical protein
MILGQCTKSGKMATETRTGRGTSIVQGDGDVEEVWRIIFLACPLYCSSSPLASFSSSIDAASGTGSCPAELGTLKISVNFIAPVPLPAARRKRPTRYPLLPLTSRKSAVHVDGMNPPSLDLEPLAAVTCVCWFVDVFVDHERWIFGGSGPWRSRGGNL